MTTPSIPPAITAPPGAGFAAITIVAGRRRLGWATFAAAFDTPSQEWVRDLSTGNLVRDLEAATDWRTGERSDFAPALVQLGAYGRAASRRGEKAESARLVAAHAELVARAGQGLTAAREACDRLAAWCDEESTAWAARETARARALRVKQDTALAGTEGLLVREAATALREHAAGAPYADLARLALTWLDREATGAGLSGATSTSRATEPRG